MVQSRADKNLTSRAATAWWNRRHPEWAGEGTGEGESSPYLDLRPRRLPRTVGDAVRVRLAARRDTSGPWITSDAVTLLDGLLQPTDRGIEWGSGGTTVWFAPRIQHLTSVEGSSAWFSTTTQRVEAAGLSNVDRHLASYDELGYGTPEHRTAYVDAAPELEPGTLDLAFVDGEYRDHCAARALDLLRPGGLLVLDNAEAYLPSTSRSPWHVERPVTPLWEKVHATISTWRSVWTTNGVWDTAVWFKP